MCQRCEEYFTIHNVKELKEYLQAGYNGPAKKEILKVWLERGYITNLIYLEHKNEVKV